MGSIQFLVAGGVNMPSSLSECIDRLADTSVLFLDAWQRTPPDHDRAGRVSKDAMKYLDHIVNEILRARDDKRSDGSYLGSSLNGKLDLPTALSASPVTRQHQQDLRGLGPGNGKLPLPGEPLRMEQLLNKIKHRRSHDANFSVGTAGEHKFYIAIDKPNRDPDSIVEFEISKFCYECAAIAPLIEGDA